MTSMPDPAVLLQQLTAITQVEDHFDTLASVRDSLLGWMAVGETEVLEQFRKSVIDQTTLIAHYTYEVFSHAYRRAPVDPETSQPYVARVVVLPFSLECEAPLGSDSLRFPRTCSALGLDIPAIREALYDIGLLRRDTDRLALFDRPVLFDELPPCLVAWQDVFAAGLAELFYGDTATWPYEEAGHSIDIPAQSAVAVFLVGIVLTPQDVTEVAPLYSQSWTGDERSRLWHDWWTKALRNNRPGLTKYGLSPGPAWVIDVAETECRVIAALRPMLWEHIGLGRRRGWQMNANVFRKGDQNVLSLDMHSVYGPHDGCQLVLPRHLSLSEAHRVVREAIDTVIIPACPSDGETPVAVMASVIH